MDMPRRLGAEFFGTFWLTFAGFGMRAGGSFRRWVSVSWGQHAFGLTVLTMAYAVGHISGGDLTAPSPSGSGPVAASRALTLFLTSSPRS